MAGHSHWAGIKHKKALIDNKRGKVWSKIAKAIMVAAKIMGNFVGQTQIGGRTIPGHHGKHEFTPLRGKAVIGGPTRTGLDHDKTDQISPVPQSLNVNVVQAAVVALLEIRQGLQGRAFDVGVVHPIGVDQANLSLRLRQLQGNVGLERDKSIKASMASVDAAVTSQSSGLAAVDKPAC